MNFTDKYTTVKLISADKEEKESKKSIISDDAYSIGEVIDNLIKKIEQTRVALLR